MSVGLFLLFNRVHVGPAGFGGWGRLSFGIFSMPSGLVVVPFIIGIVWMFGSEGSIGSKIFTGLSILFIIAAVIMNTTFWLDRMTMFDWILILTMIFGGGAMVFTILFREHNPAEDAQKAELERYKQAAESESRKVKDLEKELDAIKKSVDEKNA